jgi:S1-C subfamily serine protease
MKNVLLLVALVLVLAGSAVVVREVEREKPVPVELIAGPEREVIYVCGYLQPPAGILPAIRSQQDMIEDTMGSVCHIRVLSEFGSWQGSGSYIGDGLILTAGHVVEDALSFTITFHDGTVVEATEYYMEPTMDVGFINVGVLCREALEFDARRLRWGDVTFILGNPLGWDNCFSVSKGIVSSLDKDHDGFFGDKLMYNSDAAAYPGNSGGPVVDEDGEIIGILVGGYTGGYDNLSLCVPTEVVIASRNIYLAQLELERME